MAHVGQKVALAAVGGFGGVKARLAELGGAQRHQLLQVVAVALQLGQQLLLVGANLVFRPELTLSPRLTASVNRPLQPVLKCSALA